MPRLVRRILEMVGGLALRVLLTPVVLVWLCVVPGAIVARLGKEDDR
jgi:hypothetical protein